MSKFRRGWWVLLTICAGCGGGGSSGGGDSAELSGSIQFSSGGTTFPDSQTPDTEPNDALDQPQLLGVLHERQTRTIEGALATEDGDWIDGFDCIALDRMHVHAQLQIADASSTAQDVELALYDPVALRYVALAADRTADQSLDFHAHGAFDLVVRALSATHSKYTLSISARVDTQPIVLGEHAANEQFLGGLSSGDAVRVRASTDPLAPRRFRFTSHDNVRVIARCETLDPHACSMIVRDVTGEPALSTLASAVSSAARAGQAELELDALRLFEVEIDAQTETTHFELLLEARPPIAGARLYGSRGLAPLASELIVGSKALAPSSVSAPEYGRSRLNAVEGELLVNGPPGPVFDALLTARHARIVDRIPDGTRLIAFDLAPGLDASDRARATVALARSLSAEREVAISELNLWRARSNVPDDEFYASFQWHYPLIHLPQAWDLTTGDDSVIVAILDTGLTEHPDLVNRQFPGFDFISKKANAGDGDGIDPDPTDVGDGEGEHPSSFHGTHVAGTIGAETNNGIGVAGVTWAGRLMHVRVLGKQGGTDFDIANAIRFSAGLSNNSDTEADPRADVINMSLGGAGFSQTMQNAVNAARSAGVVLFAAAGNENTSTPSYPAAYSGVISVAAVDINAKRAFYSNKGSTIDLCAPGGDLSQDLDGDGYGDGVLSTKLDDSTNPPSNVYAFEMGTSMACPHAAGVASLMIAAAAARGGSLTPSEIESILKDTATDLGAVGRDDLYGEGLIDAYLAVLLAGGGRVPGEPQLSITPAGLLFGASQTSLKLAVKNQGGGMLDIGTIQAVLPKGETWLSFQSIATEGPGTSDTSSILVAIDRTGLGDGTYTGTLEVDSNAGAQSIPVSMVVAAGAPPPDVDIFVVALDADTMENMGEVVVNPAQGLDYSLSDLPAGSYLLVAGSDDDGDNAICGDGDLYCGLYPTLNEPLTIEIGEGESIDNLDFPVTAQSVNSTALSARGLHSIRLAKPASAGQ